MEYEHELFKIQEYCKECANFISNTDSKEDKFARQAYLDVSRKIVEVFKRAMQENKQSEVEKLNLPAVGKCEDVEREALLIAFVNDIKKKDSFLGTLIFEHQLIDEFLKSN